MIAEVINRALAEKVLGAPCACPCFSPLTNYEHAQKVLRALIDAGFLVKRESFVDIEVCTVTPISPRQGCVVGDADPDERRALCFAAMKAFGLRCE